MSKVFAARYPLWGLAALHAVAAIGAFAAIAEFHAYHSMLDGDELAGRAAALADVYDPAPWYGRLIRLVTLATTALAVTTVTLLALPRSRDLPGKPSLERAWKPRLPGKSRDLGAAAGIACVLLAGGSAVPQAIQPKENRHVEPAHEVVYFYIVPAAAATDRFEITYLDALGRPRSDTQPGYPPAWVELVRLPQGGTALELIVRSSATSTAPMIQCRIQVDGRIERSSDGNPCRVRLTFPLTNTNGRQK